METYRRDQLKNRNKTSGLFCVLMLIVVTNITASGWWESYPLILANDTLVIVAFGNSITAERGTVKKVFAQRLPNLLSRQGITVKVINAGIPGSHTGRRTDHDLFKIRHGMDRFESDVLSHDPDLVIIGFGTNDSYIDSKVKGGDARIPRKSYSNNLTHFITRLQAIDAKVILMAPNILGAKYPDFQNRRLLKYVKVVRRLSRKYKIPLVDNYKLFVTYQKRTHSSFDQLMLDGCHPNDKGHELIAHELVTAILEIEK